jgi:hypothetical protein
LGGKVLNLPDGKRATFIKLLLVKEEIISIQLQADKEKTRGCNNVGCNNADNGHITATNDQGYHHHYHHYQ